MCWLIDCAEQFISVRLIDCAEQFISVRLIDCTEQFISVRLIDCAEQFISVRLIDCAEQFISVRLIDCAEQFISVRLIDCAEQFISVHPLSCRRSKTRKKVHFFGFKTLSLFYNRLGYRLLTNGLLFFFHYKEATDGAALHCTSALLIIQLRTKCT
jgi:hypothetical protein